MVTAIVLTKVQRSGVNEVAQRLTEIEGVSEVYSVGGRYDLVVVIRASTNEKMADVVTNRMTEITGILDTETMVAFKSHSRHDLESMFSIGLEEGTQT